MIVPKHSVTDISKLAIFEALFADGVWPDNVPAVLTVGDEAITGSHRIQAAKNTETPIKSIDLLAEGVDFEELGYDLTELLTTLDDAGIAQMLREAGRNDLAEMAA